MLIGNSSKKHSEIIQSKIHTKEIIVKEIGQWRLKNNTVVFTNGCFDILHQGHIDYLSKAADMGNVLIVGVNSDASVKRLGKGNNRPIQNETSRAAIIAALHAVAAVVVFDEDTPFELINAIQPDVLVKGADYDANETDAKSKKYIVGSDVVKAKGGQVKTIEFLEGFSTTHIENKIKGIK